LSTTSPPHQALLTAYLAASPDLVRFFTARLRSREAAEDLVQEMYERMLRVAPDESIANPSAYLYRLGSNLLLDQVRYDRRRTARETAWTGENSGRPGAIDTADEPAPDEVADARRRLAHLLAIADTLPTTTRRAFRLHKLDGLSHAETAAAMGLSRSAVEKHVSAALKFLLARLG
jgi:RNA polymerase sigma-70 factor (ECF subfamily)